MKRTICLLLSLIALFTAVFSTGTVVYARDPIVTKTFDFSKYEYEYEIEEDMFEFYLSKPSAVYVKLDVSFDMDDIGHTYEKQLDGTEGVNLNIYRYSEDEYDYESITECDRDFKVAKNQTDQSFWCYTNVLPAGYHYYEIDTLYNSHVADATICDVKLYTYSGFAKAAKVPATATLNVDDEKKINITNLSPGNTIAGASWTISDTKIAKFVRREKDYVIVKGKKAGKFTLTAKLKNGKKYNCKVTVKKGKPKLNQKSIELIYGYSKTLKMKNTKKKVTWTTSNSKIATVSAKGKVTAKGTGNCKITAKCGGKKYTCNVKVYKLPTDFTACVTDYYTRDNYFEVEFHNYGKKSLVLLSSGANCREVNYKEYDRKLFFKGNKNITIKPGQSKTVRFYVKGSTTWPYYEDFTIRYYFKYNGGKYLGEVWSTNSTYKRGGKWKDTYMYDYDMELLRGEYDY